MTQPTATAITGSPEASRQVIMAIGSDQASVQATVRHGTNHRPSVPACAAATTRNVSRYSAASQGL
jgi:hypothetical protein